MAKLAVRAYLKRHGISVREFARMVGLDVAAAFRYMRPGANPTLATLSAWARALKCKVRDLIKE